MTDAALVNDHFTVTDSDRLAVDIEETTEAQWSPRRTLVFVVGASSCAWALILLPFVVGL